MNTARKTVPAESSLATAAPLPAGTIVKDGVKLVSVKPSNSIPFARACLAILKQRDGRDHTYKLELGAFWVPEDVLPMARELVESGDEKVSL